MQIETKIVGMHFHPPGKQIAKALEIGTPLILQTDPANEYSSNAVKVLVDLSSLLEDDAFQARFNEAFDPGQSLEGYGIEDDELTSEPRFFSFIADKGNTDKIIPIFEALSVGYTVSATFSRDMKGNPLANVSWDEEEELSEEEE